ncbi:6-bladed beta-propeller [Parabacteroides pacaensis]|uniref:6-bladed beta-propeller n=1 Tax=Parabacteroides pacaensis TaxID=2086575 RepID=UPI000D114C96|nr:6-bladed beta-propeller [Parabacteroides pacaensis]
MKYIWINIITIAFFSCTSNTIKKGDEHFTFSLNEKNGFTSIIDTAFFIPLETSNEVLIKQKPSIICHDSTIYILSKGLKRLYSFDMKGKIKSILNKYGKGANEYLEITDFLINNKGIYIYDNITGNLFHYTREGEYKNKVKLRSGASHIIEYQNQYILYVEFPQNNEFAIYIYDNKGNLINNYFPNEKASFYTAFSVKRPLNILPEGVTINFVFDYNTYLLRNNNITEKYYFNFCDNNLPPDFKAQNKKNPNIIEELIKLNNKVLWISCITKLNDWLLFYVETSDRNYHICTSLNTKQFYLSSNTIHPFDLLEEDITTYNDFFVGTIPANYIPDLQELKGTELSNKYLDRFLNIQENEDSNPIVCFFKLKNL